MSDVNPGRRPDPGADEHDVVRRSTTSSEGSATYTRSSMETSALGSRRQVQLDSVARQANDALDQAAERVRALMEALAGDVPSAELDAAMSMALLGAHEQERSRLAEELHDGPAQALANAIFQTEILEHAVRDDPAAAKAELASLREILERELDTLRAYINQLRPSLGEEAGLEEALRDAAAGLTQRIGVPVDFRLEAKEGRLHQTARTVVLRVAQEALRNIAKHAAPSRVWITTTEDESPESGRRWTLEVGDDGRGFDLDSVSSHPNRRHFGLRFMRERSDLLGSELSITTSPAAGTVVRLHIDMGAERS